MSRLPGRSGAMTEKYYHLTNEHAHILVGLSKDIKQNIVHHSHIDGFSEDELAKLYNLPVEVVWAILAHQQ
jgi:hypothetical protein